MKGEGKSGTAIKSARGIARHLPSSFFLPLSGMPNLLHMYLLLNKILLLNEILGWPT
jgi:hypothetical protein